MNHFRWTEHLRSGEHRHGEGARNEQVHRRGALKRAEVAFVKNRREEWWECPNRSCGAQILFLMIGPAPNGDDPTCFCGSMMKRVVKTRGQRHRSAKDCETNISDSPGCERASHHPPPAPQRTSSTRIRRFGPAAVSGSTGSSLND
jgi:hypothetical protein